MTKYQRSSVQGPYKPDQFWERLLMMAVLLAILAIAAWGGDADVR